MVRISLTFQKDQKREQTVECQNFQGLKESIVHIFRVELGSIKILKPPIKDEASFQSYIKDKQFIQITFNGTQDQKKKKPIKKKQIKKKDSQVSQEQLRQKLDYRYKVKRNHQRRGVKQRGIIHFDDQKNDVQDIGTDHLTSVAHLFRIIPEIRKFCLNYKLSPRNPSGLFIEETNKLFQHIEGEAEELADPLQWAISFMVHCADFIEEDFPYFHLQYIAKVMVQTIDETQKRQDVKYHPEPKPLNKKQQSADYKTMSLVRKWFGIYMKKKVYKEQQEKQSSFKFRPRNYQQKDEEKVQEGKKETLSYVFKCDLSVLPQCLKLEKAIEEMFDQKIYKDFEIFRLPKYLFVDLNYVGYPQEQIPQDEGDVNFELDKRYCPVEMKKKRFPNFKVPEILNMNKYCNEAQKEKNRQGMIHREYLFHSLKAYGRQMSEMITFEEFKQMLKKKKDIKVNSYEENQLLYMFYEHNFLLQYSDSFDEFYFENTPEYKATGDYRLIGAVLHRGQYYHDGQKKYGCYEHEKEKMGDVINEYRGQFMTLVYKKDRKWLKFQRQNAWQIDIEEVEQYLMPKNNPVEGNLKDTWTPSLLLYREICPTPSYAFDEK